RWVARRQGEHAGERSEITWVVQGGVFLAAVYGSYFGAGLGVVLLSIFGILLTDGLQRLNALKGLLSFVINAVSVVVFVVAGHVEWWSTGILAVTAWAGGALGVGVARRLSPAVLRYSVIALGVVVAVVLIVKG
ncbi:MAG TPA: sulfite exporter TauE/SafE family protein, partial [Acidimicrobiales bacterium]|nr:sulfite exporter TauE/SafE family protein [Acidimicrobiales bacterium]